MSSKKIVSSLAKAVAATAFGGPAAGAAAGVNEAIDLFANWRGRSEKDAYNTVLERLRRDLERFAQGEGLDPGLVNQGLEEARRLIAVGGATVAEMNELGLNPRRVAERVLGRGRRGIEQLDEGADEVCRSAVHAAYISLMAEPAALPGLEIAYQRAVLTGLAELREPAPELLELQRDLARLLDRLPPEPADRFVVEEYLRAVIAELDHDAWTRMAGGRSSSLTLIARQLPFRWQAQSGDGDRRQDDLEVSDVATAIAPFERVVVLGGPGTGKTWLARRTAMNAAKVALEEFSTEQDPVTVEIPMFARCADVLGTSEPTWDALVHAAVRRVAGRLGPSRVRESLERRFLEQPGRYLVVLDALDEADTTAGEHTLDGLVATPHIQMQVLLTARPGSWRHQLPLEPGRRHRVVELQRLRYPEDVTAVIDAWLADNSAARDRLLDLLRRRVELAQLARTPLLCAMCCLLAETVDTFPATRSELHGEAVGLLLSGRWDTRRRHLDDQQLERARAAVSELAWAGALDDSNTGLAAWPDKIRHTFSPPLEAPALEAVSHVAPTAAHQQSGKSAPRQFIHPSLREHLVAWHVGGLPVAEAAAVLEPHLWYDSTWEQVTPLAIASSESRDELLDRLLQGAEPGVAASTIDARDGFGELRRMLVRLACVSVPTAWSPEHVALIDATLVESRAREGRADAAANGWSGARPTGEDVDRLRSGQVPWPNSEISDQIAHLQLTPVARESLIRGLLKALDRGRRWDGSIDSSWKEDVVTALVVLGATRQQRQAAEQILTRRLRDEINLVDVRALRALCAGQPAPAALARRTLAAFGELEDTFGAEYEAYELAEVIDLLGADDATRSDAASRLLDLLSGTATKENCHWLVQAFRRLRPQPAQQARLIDILIERLPGASDSYETRMRMHQILEVLPSAETAGAVLRLLVETGQAWSDTRHSAELVRSLAARATEPERRDAAAALTRRLETTAVPELRERVAVLAALDPTDTERDAVVERLVVRLADTPSTRCGHIAAAVRMLGANADQRRRLVRHLVDRLREVDDDVHFRILLCEMASWYEPQGNARSAIVDALAEAASTVSPTWLADFKSAAAQVQLADRESDELTGRLISRLPAVAAHEAFFLAELICAVGASPRQRTAAADSLVARLPSETTRDLDYIVFALRELDAPSEWRHTTGRAVMDRLLHEPPEAVRYASWAELLPTLDLPTLECRRLADRFLEHLQPKDVHLGHLDEVLEAVDALDASAERDGAVRQRLLALLAIADAYTAGSIAWRLGQRGPTAEQRRRAVDHLLARLVGASPEMLPGLLDAVSDLGPEGRQYRVAVKAALEYLERGSPVVERILDALLAMGELDEAAKGRAMKAILDKLKDSKLWVNEATLERLVHLGLDAAALARFASQLRTGDDGPGETVLRDLAGALRRSTSAEAWQESLSALAEANALVYAAQESQALERGVPGGHD